MLNEAHKKSSDESHTWLMVAYFLILFFLYEWMVMYTVMINGCLPMEYNWLSENKAGFSLFSVFIVVFVLFAGWMLGEIIASHIGNYRDKWFCTGIGLFVVFLVMAVLGTFRIHWEAYEVLWGERGPFEFSIQLNDRQAWPPDYSFDHTSMNKGYCPESNSK